MNRIMKYAAAALAAATAVSTLGGCDQIEPKTEQDTVAISFGDTDIMLDEVTYMIRSMEYTYEMYFGSEICSSDLGDGSGATVGDYIKEMALQEIRQTLVLNEYAEQNNIELSESQKELVEQAVAELKEDGQEYLDIVGATDEILEKVYTQNAIANLVYLDLVSDVDTTVGDDEFLRKKIAYVKLTPSELTEVTTEEITEEASEEESASEESAEESAEEASETAEIEEETTEEATSEEATAKAAEEETISAEEKERQEAMEKAAAEILEKFENGEDAADFISDYQNDTHFSAIKSQISISEEKSAVYAEAAWALATDECTIYTSDDGSIYIIRCINDNDEEARATAIESEIESRKTELFEEKYVDIQENSSKFKVDEDVLATITFDEPVYVTEAATEAETEESEVESEEETEIESEEESEEETEIESEEESEAETEE